jgi:hypothetical protein
MRRKSIDEQLLELERERRTAVVLREAGQALRDALTRAPEGSPEAVKLRAALCQLLDA